MLTESHVVLVQQRGGAFRTGKRGEGTGRMQTNNRSLDACIYRRIQFQPLDKLIQNAVHRQIPAPIPLGGTSHTQHCLFWWCSLGFTLNHPQLQRTPNLGVS